MDFFWSVVETARELWPHILTGVVMLTTAAAAAHLVMYKKDTRAAIGWIGVVLMVPFFGALLYAVFGINRLQRRAVTLRDKLAPYRNRMRKFVATEKSVSETLAAKARHLVSLERLVGRLTGRPLLYGNRVTPMVGGAEAYPEMIAAIEGAERSVAMASYIFDRDRAGKMFAEALRKAVARGVEVRVIVDAIGARYSFPSILHTLRQGKVPTARFLPTLQPFRFAYTNLRSHRKILVVDGKLGFTGGLNIREGHDERLKPKHPIQDHHFRLEGPVVNQMQEVFAEDWAFCTGQVLEGDAWFPELKPVGTALARGISAGPDGDYDKRLLTLEGALAAAERSVCIVTPYFLPETSLIAALNVAALRGVQVDIILPQANNLALVKWASMAQLWQVLERGCRVWMSPPPFDHTKLMLVDRAWTLLGSGNWDPRSLRLNFEFDVECYDVELAEQLHDWMADKRRRAHEVTLAEVDARSVPIRLRDGVARLLTPYL